MQDELYCATVDRSVAVLLGFGGGNWINLSSYNLNKLKIGYFLQSAKEEVIEFQANCQAKRKAKK